MGAVRLYHGWVERREARHKVLIRARMRASGLPVDICICDISARGACIMTANPPARGTIVELIDTPFPIVGTVAWSSERRLGLQARNRIDVRAFLALQGRGGASGSVDLAVQRVRPSQRHEASRHIGRALEFGLVLLAVGAVAMAVGEGVYHRLSTAAHAAEQGMKEPARSKPSTWE